MPIKLPFGWIIALNVGGWPAIHLAAAALFLRLPGQIFNADGWLFRRRDWESDGHFYEKLTGVRIWKHLLPDGAPFLRGFAKKNLASTDRPYLLLFMQETCRGELAHWAMILAAAIFFVWNPIWADAVMCAYAIAANLPCIVTQRYNRIRLRRLTDATSNRASLR